MLSFIMWTFTLLSFYLFVGVCFAVLFTDDLLVFRDETGGYRSLTTYSKCFRYILFKWPSSWFVVCWNEIRH